MKFDKEKLNTENIFSNFLNLGQETVGYGPWKVARSFFKVPFDQNQSYVLSYALFKKKNILPIIFRDKL